VFLAVIMRLFSKYSMLFDPLGSRSVLSVSDVAEQPTPGVDATLVSAASDTLLGSVSTSRVTRCRKRALSQPEEPLPVLDVDVSVMDVSTSVIDENALVVDANQPLVDGHASAMDVASTFIPEMAVENEMERLQLVEADDYEPLPSNALSESNSGQRLVGYFIILHCFVTVVNDWWVVS